MMDIAAVIAVAYKNGTVGRMQLFARDDDDSWTDTMIQAEVDKAAISWAAMGLTVVGWHRCELADFPADNDFRAAWTVQDGNVVVDVDRARECTKDRLRSERAPLMAANDVEALRALEAGDQKAAAVISAEKQRLRDVTTLPQIAEAETLDDLRAITCVQSAPYADRAGG